MSATDPLRKVLPHREVPGGVRGGAGRWRDEQDGPANAVGLHADINMLCREELLSRPFPVEAEIARVIPHDRQPEPEAVRPPKADCPIAPSLLLHQVREPNPETQEAPILGGLELPICEADSGQSAPELVSWPGGVKTPSGRASADGRPADHEIEMPLE